MKKRIAYFAILALLSASCSTETNSESASNASTNSVDNSNPIQGISSEQPLNSEQVKDETPTSNDNIEMYLKAGEILADVVGDAIETKKLKDSIRVANKEKMYAYQIGLQITDKDELFESFNKLSEAGVSNLYVLKKGKNDFILVKYEAKPENELKDSLDAFKLRISSIHNEKVDVINLMSECDKKEIIKKGEKLTKRKEDSEIPCLICD
jgi:hypothetical protein